MDLSRRIARLEVRARASGTFTCPECGLPPPGSALMEAVRFVVAPPLLIGSPEPDTSNDRCRACGAMRVLRLRFDRNG